MCPDGGKIINKATLEIINHNYKREKLCQDVTDPFQVNTGTYWSPPFISAGRKGAGCVCALNTDPLFWEGKCVFQKVHQAKFTQSGVEKQLHSLSSHVSLSAVCFRALGQEEVVIFMASFLLDLTQGWAWETWRVLLCAQPVSWPRLVFAYGCCDNNYRAGSEGLIDLCVHAIVCLNLARNCEILREGRIICRMCEDVRMDIMCWPKGHIDSKLGQWPERDSWWAEQSTGQDLLFYQAPLSQLGWAVSPSKSKSYSLTSDTTWTQGLIWPLPMSHEVWSCLSSVNCCNLSWDTLRVLVLCSPSIPNSQDQNFL